MRANLAQQEAACIQTQNERVRLDGLLEAKSVEVQIVVEDSSEDEEDNGEDADGDEDEEGVEVVEEEVEEEN